MEKLGDTMITQQIRFWDICEACDRHKTG